MLVTDLLYNNTTATEWDIINRECSQFVAESCGIPIYKVLPSNYQNLHKVKARFKKKDDVISNVFNSAFVGEAHKLSQRAIFAYPTIPTTELDLDLFYIFPTNGYRFLYSKEVTNSTSDYKSVIDTVFETFNNTTKATEIVADLLKYTYSTQSLYEGLKNSAEIIFYGIPHYYAVRVNNNLRYDQIINHHK